MGSIFGSIFDRFLDVELELQFKISSAEERFLIDFLAFELEFQFKISSIYSKNDDFFSLDKSSTFPTLFF